MSDSASNLDDILSSLLVGNFRLLLFHKNKTFRILPLIRPRSMVTLLLPRLLPTLLIARPFLHRLLIVRLCNLDAIILTLFVNLLSILSFSLSVSHSPQYPIKSSLCRIQRPMSDMEPQVKSLLSTNAFCWPFVICVLI